MLQFDEMTSTMGTFSSSCVKCNFDNGSKSSLTPPNKHRLREVEIIEQNPKLKNGGCDFGEVEIIEQNPKLKNGGCDFGGGFVKDKRRFMVAHNLQISPISSISTITKGIDFLIPDLVEKEVNGDKAKVYCFLLGIYAIFALLIN
ncbi:hypothetical protein KFK09_029065 [Dendrobium nobile]|uniref:Uncharacterized protein n=1 Tax=Dendrobium nobile TaxID=94219 RepID=A0A8T3A9J9_DENNO|nr:hypothetical protein KFK09_029065 [Dendrobium nobile]